MFSYILLAWNTGWRMFCSLSARREVIHSPLDELKDQYQGTRKAFSLALERATAAGKIVAVRKGFYVILPPEFAESGMLPVTYFIDDMMRYLKRDYYIGHLSAAALLGAGHQQPMNSYVMIKKPPMRTITKKNLNLSFLVKQDWDQAAIRQLKTDMGPIPVSSPELTALDLLYFQKYGGVNRVIPIIDELSEQFSSDGLMKAAGSFPFKSAIKRLGYLLDHHLDQHDHAHELHGYIDDPPLCPPCRSSSQGR